jgi:hypothetical protein
VPSRVWTLIVALGWVVTFLFSLGTTVILNDHFYRISAARQIARYGELPFRDFFDPGYFMTELASAGLQILLGDNLLGEVLLNAAFIASGTVLVSYLAGRISGSVTIGVAAGLFALLSMPRAYDYDKFLFYPLGILLSWRYIETQTSTSVIALAVGLIAGALFRYDTGVYIGITAAIALFVLHFGAWKVFARRAIVLGVAVVVTILPFGLFVHTFGGLSTALDQMRTYGVREAQPDRRLPPPPNLVHLRIAASVGDENRRSLAVRYRLTHEAQEGDPQDRTWAYLAEDTSPETIRALVEDPRVEDTHRIDRRRYRLVSQDPMTRFRRNLPLPPLRPGTDLYSSNAAAFLYFTFLVLPIFAAFLVAFRTATRAAQARLWSLIAMCVVLNVWIMRAPVESRFGGMAGPVSILAAWILGLVVRSSVSTAERSGLAALASKIAAAIMVVLTCSSMSVVARWQMHLSADTLRPSQLRERLARFATTPPDLINLPNREYEGIVRYVRECTGHTERFYAAWFAPELHFFAQRPFTTGMLVTFGSHWSEERFQKRSVEIWKSHAVPIVIMRHDTADEFAADYPLLHTHLLKRYVVAGDTNFGDPSTTYRVWVDRERVPTSKHVESSMPCFARVN